MSGDPETSAQAHTHDEPDEQELAGRLRAHGMRMTSQRQSVMAAVTRLVHATPEQIAETVPDVDLTTIYRTLDTLEHLGLLAHTHLGHGAPSYRLASDDHIHVVCHHCGSVVDAPSGLVEPMAERLLAERGFTIDRSHFTVFGTCATCASSDHPPAGKHAHEH